MSGKGKKRTAIKISEVYENLIEGAPDSIVAVDLKGNITYCNKATEILTGHVKEELIGKHFSRVGWIKKKDIPHYLKLFKELQSGKKIAPLEIEVSHKDGKSHWIEVHVSKIKAKGKVTGFQVNVKNITDRRQVEESSRQKVLELNSFINNIPDMAWLKDDKSRFIALNKAFGEVAGMKPETLIGQTCEACFGASAGKKFREDDLKVMKGRKQVKIEEKILDSKGKELWLETIKSPTFGESGKVVGTVGIARNVTERKQAEDQLGKLSRAVEQSPSIVMVTDTKGTIEYVNPKFTQITGYTTEEIIGTNARNLGEQPSEEQKQMWNTITSGGEWRGEFHNKKKTGELYWEFASISPIKNRKGLITHFLKVAEDITERKRAGEALIRGERIATERARLLTDLRDLDRIDDVLTRVCEAVRDSRLFERAVMTLHDQVRQIVHLGQVGLPSDVVKRARQAPPIDKNLRARVTSKKFRISDSFFIPAEAGVDFSKTSRHVPQKRRKSVGGNWQPGDELFVPLRDFSGKIMGYLSVDTPTDGSRPDVKTIQALEMLVEAAAARVREVEARDALKQERDFSQSILKTANSLIVCLDADANIMAFNQECEKVTGYRREEVLGKRWPELFLPPDHHHFKLKSFANWVRAHPRDRYEGPIVTKSGEIRTILWSNTAILGSGKRDVVAIAIGQDITERKQAELALKESEERYRMVSELTSDYVCKINIDSENHMIMELITEGFTRISGYTLDEVKTPDAWRKAFHPDDQDKASSFLKDVISRRQRETEIRGLTKKGEIRWLRIYGQAEWDENEQRVSSLILAAKDLTEHKRAEEELNRIFNLSSDMIGVASADGYFKKINPSVEKILGYTVKEFLDTPYPDLIHPDDRARTADTVKKEFATGMPTIKFENRYRCKDGSYKWLEWTARPIKEEKLTYAVARDITERKRAEEALKQSQKKYKELADSLPQIVFEMAKKGNLTFVNRNAFKLYGYTEEDFDKGINVLQTIIPADRDRAKKNIQRRLRGERSDGNEYIALRKDGTTFPIVIHSAPIIHGNKVVGLRGIIVDLTERKRTEEALQESEERFRTISTTAKDAILMIDNEGNISYWNPAAEEIFGYSSQEAIGKELHILLAPKRYHEVYRKGFSNFKKTGQGVAVGKTLEFGAIRKDGTEFSIELSLSAIKIKGKWHAVAIVRDITERKKVEETLKASENKYRTLLENLPQKIFLKDRNSVYLSCNESYARDLKINAEEITGKTDHDFFPKELAEKYRSDDKRVMKLGKTEDFEERYIQDGQRVFVQTVKTPIKDERGNLIGLLGIFWDISERKRAEEALQESEERYRSLFEDSPISLWEEDFSDVKKFIDGLRAKGVKDFTKYFENHPEAVAKCATMVKVVDVNNASLELFKAKSKEELQLGLRNTFSEESYDVFREELIAITRGESTFETEATTRTLKGSKKHVMVRWSVAPGYEKTLSKVLVSINDITELKKAREQNLLLETSKALSRTLKLDQVLKIGTEKMAKALKADRCGVALSDQNMQSVTVKHVYLEDGSPSRALLDSPLSFRDSYEAKESVRTKGYYRILNTRTDAIPKSLREYLFGVGVKSSLIIPMFIGKKLLGLFNIGSVKKLRSFTEEEIRLAQTVANQVAVAIQNTLLIEDLKKKHSQITQQSKTLERQYQEQTILMKISRELSKTLDLDRILQIATKETARALQVDRCAASLAFPEEGYAEVRCIYVKGEKPVTHLLGYKLYGHYLPQAKEMFEKRKSLSIPNIYHLPDKSFAKKYFIKEGMKSALFSPMVHGKKLVGFFTLSTTKDFRTFTKEETKLAQTIANQTAVAIENARLLEVVRRSSEDLKRLSSQLINVQEEERKKLAQELHDQIGQTLFAMKMNLDVTKKNLPPDIEKLEDIKNRLGDTDDLVSDTIDRIRNLTTDLRPSMLDDFGLISALNWYIDNFSKRTNIKVYLKTKNFKGRLSSEIETTLYRVIQEALTNVAKHAQATGVSILLSRENSFASLSVEDNGRGFNTKKIPFAKDRLGLFSIRERVKLLKGEFKIGSKPNKGTKLNVKIPLTERRV